MVVFRGAGDGSRTRVTSLENWDNSRYMTPARCNGEYDILTTLFQSNMSETSAVGLQQLDCRRELISEFSTVLEVEV